MMLVSCAEDDFVSAEPEYHDAVLIKCAVADYITEESDMTRGITRGMEYDDNIITKLDLMIFDSKNDSRLLKHLSVENLSATETHTWDITGLMPKDYLINGNVDIYLIANYYPEEHNDNKNITDFNPKNATEFFAVSKEDPFPPGKMLNNGIVMAQVISGDKNSFHNDNATGNLIMTFDKLERVMAKAEFFVSTYDDMMLLETIDFNDQETFKDGWVTADKNATWNRLTLYQATNNTNNSPSLNIKNTSGQDRAAAKYNLSDKFINANDWKIEFDFGGKDASYRRPYLDVKDGDGSIIFNISFRNEYKKDGATITWPFDKGDIGESQTASVSYSDAIVSTNVVLNGFTISKEQDRLCDLTETESVNYVDEDENILTETFNQVKPDKDLSSAAAEDNYYISYKFKPNQWTEFKPTKLSFNAARFVTDRGLMDIYIYQDGNKQEIIKRYKPERPDDFDAKGTAIDVDITNPSGGSGSYSDSNGNLDSYRKNETVNLTFNSTEQSIYELTFDYATVYSDFEATFIIKDNNNNILYQEPIELEKTEAWQSYNNVTGKAKTQILSANATYTLQIVFGESTEGDFTANIKNIKLTPLTLKNYDNDSSEDANARISKTSFDLELDSKAGEVEVRFYIYDLTKNKTVGLSDIVLQGNFKDVGTDGRAIANFNNTMYDLTLDPCSNNTNTETEVVNNWYHVSLESNGAGNILCNLAKSDGTKIIDNIAMSSSLHPDHIYLELQKNYAHWAIDNIKLYGSVAREITEYKVQNYTNGYTLFNVNDVDKSTETDIKNKADVAYTNEGFSKLAEHPESLKDAENNSFAFYFYPNYWFDTNKATNMAKEEPIIYGRQTHVLIKANYEDKDYYYKVPINFRLPKYSDAHQSQDHFNSKIDECLNTLYEKIEDANYSYSGLQDYFYNYVKEYIFYQKSNPAEPADATQLSTIKTGCDKVISDAYTAMNTLYNDTSKTYKDDEEKKEAVIAKGKEAATSYNPDDNNETLETGLDYIYSVFQAKNITEAERLCRIQRNHHYKITVNIDKPGGETADEAVYIMPAPYGDITARPEF